MRIGRTTLFPFSNAFSCRYFENLVDMTVICTRCFILFGRGKWRESVPTTSGWFCTKDNTACKIQDCRGCRAEAEPESSCSSRVQGFCCETRLRFFRWHLWSCSFADWLSRSDCQNSLVSRPKATHYFGWTRHHTRNNLFCLVNLNCFKTSMFNLFPWVPRAICMSKQSKH